MIKSLGVIALMTSICLTAHAEDSVYRRVVDGEIIRGKIAKGETYSFKVRLLKDDGFIEYIEVYLPNGTKSQVIEFPEDAEMPCSTCNLIDLMDLNFDGYQDMLLLVGWGSGGSLYKPFIFDPVAKKFEPSVPEIILENPSVDIKTKEVQTSSHMGCCAGTTRWYKVNRNKVTLLREFKYGDN